MSVFVRLLALICCGVAGAADSVVVSIRGSATSADERVLLGEVAELSAPPELAARLAAIEVLRLVDGRPQPIDASVIRPRLASWSQIHFTINGSGSVQRDSRLISATDLDAAAMAHLRSRIQAQGGDAVDIQVRRSARALSLPSDSEAPELLAEPLVAEPWGEVPYRVRVLVAGVEWERVLVLLHARTRRLVAVATRDLVRGQTVSLQDMRLELRDDGPALRTASGAIDIYAGAIVQRPVAAGEVLTDRQVRHPPAVEAGQQVQLVVRQGSVALTLAAESLLAGRTGDVVRVRSVTGRVLPARVAGPGVVIHEP